jgi:FMN-dependent NADH-azoreductase
MMSLLHVDSSANLEGSHSKALAREFVAAWSEVNPGEQVIYRDLGASPVPPIDQHFIAGLYLPPETRTPEQAAAFVVSDQLINELIEADTYVFAVPMYNFTVPAQFKAYIDQIVRFGRTVSFGASGIEGLLGGKRAVIISSRGGDYSKGGPREAFDFHEPYLRKLLAMIGVTDVSYVPVSQNPMHDDETTRGRKLDEARAALVDVLRTWSDHGVTVA